MFRFYLNLIAGIGFLIFCYCAYLYEQQKMNKPLFGIIVLIVVGIVGIISMITKKSDKIISNQIHKKYDNNNIDPKIFILIACVFVSILLYKLSGIWYYLIMGAFSSFCILFFIIKNFKNKRQ